MTTKLITINNKHTNPSNMKGLQRIPSDAVVIYRSAMNRISKISHLLYIQQLHSIIQEEKLIYYLVKSLELLFFLWMRNKTEREKEKLRCNIQAIFKFLFYFVIIMYSTHRDVMMMMTMEEKKKESKFFLSRWEIDIILPIYYFHLKFTYCSALGEFETANVCFYLGNGVIQFRTVSPDVYGKLSVNVNTVCVKIEGLCRKCDTKRFNTDALDRLFFLCYKLLAHTVKKKNEAAPKFNWKTKGLHSHARRKKNQTVVEGWQAMTSYLFWRKAK